MASGDDVHKDLYDKINANTAAVASLAATVAVLTAQNERFIKLLENDNQRLTKVFKWVAVFMFLLIIFLVTVIAYGAIGDKGLHSVRQNQPNIPGLSMSAIMPWHNNLDEWLHRQSS